MVVDQLCKAARHFNDRHCEILITLERTRENVNGSVASPRTRGVHLIQEGGCALVRAPEPPHVFPWIKSFTSLPVSTCCDTCKNMLQPNFHRSNFSLVTLVMCGSPNEEGPYELGDHLPARLLQKGQQRMGPGTAWQTQ